jgi:pre-rRNA-processing protein SRD1
MTIGSPTNEVEANDLHTPTNATVRQRASEHNIQQSLTLEDQSDATRSFVYELAPDRNTSWQYELHKVMLTNRRLKRALDNSLNAQTSTTNSPIVTETTCSNCFKRQTTQWRKGPEGPRSLCNSCGLRYAKQLNQRKNDAG